MNKPKTNAQGWALVLTRISRPELGRQIGISKQAIHKWDEVPLRFVVDIERITGIPREHILPENIDFFRPSSLEKPHEEAQN